MLPTRASSSPMPAAAPRFGWSAATGSSRPTWSGSSATAGTRSTRRPSGWSTPCRTRWSSGWRPRWGIRPSIPTATRSPTPTARSTSSCARPLADVAVGETVEIRRVDEREPERLRYLGELGLVPGVVVTVRDRQPFGGPVTVESGGRAPQPSGPSWRTWSSAPRRRHPMSAASYDRPSRSSAAGGTRAPTRACPSRTTASRCRAASRSGARRSPSPARATWWPWATWIRATGPPTSPAARGSATRC